MPRSKGRDGRQRSRTLPTAPSAAAVVPPPLAGRPPLPEGWQELTDADGDVYFHHTSTGETSWDRPC